MFDIAYVSEASVEAARKEKSKLWDLVLKSDLSKPLACYWQIILYTHGGV